MFPVFSKIFDFRENLFRGIFGLGVTNLIFILPYEASVTRCTTKMSTFHKINFICISNNFLLLVSMLHDKNMALRDPDLLEFAQLIGTEEVVA